MKSHADFILLEFLHMTAYAYAYVNVRSQLRYIHGSHRLLHFFLCSVTLRLSVCLTYIHPSLR